MIFKQFNFEGCLSYIVACPTERKGVIIDPSHEMQPYLDFIRKTGIEILYVIDTHTHVDHISLSPELARVFSAKTVMNAFTPMQREIGATITELFGIEKIIAENAAKPVNLYLRENDSLTIGDISLKALYTPGHTKDSMCLLTNDRIFTGDTLIIGQCGRTDLPGGSPQDMYDSLFAGLVPLSNDLVVYPAHDYKGNINSSLGYEKVNNVCLKTPRTIEEFATFLKGLFPPLSADGGKLQCGLSMGDATPSAGDDQINPLMKSFCISMEHYLQTPHEATLIRTGELLEKTGGREKIFILDVREPGELSETGFIPGAVNIPVREVAKRIDELPKDLDHPIVVVCESGIRSAHAAIYLRAYGYANVKNLEFGIREWRNNGYPLVFPGKNQ
ncbi:MAG: putative polyketide biosynthesis zinc-dependent hydrolase PksB [Syntrophorhabdus sp. PtaU1.Bin002]|nr:MAG: putative polyketide biosynthesis zinc-dependent hydrolase PksB [Syntrophorhabdus sp. PtaU1.Bin002]